MADEVRTYRKEDGLDDNEVYAVFSKRVFIRGEEYDYNSHVESSIRISASEDGSIWLTDDKLDGCLRFFPDQLAHLEHVIEVAKEQAGKSVGGTLGELEEKP